METQKAIKMTRKAMSLHFLLCLMIPFPPIWIVEVPSLDVYLPTTAPKEPLILKLAFYLYCNVTSLNQFNIEGTNSLTCRKKKKKKRQK